MRSVHALYPFHIWSDDLARRAETLAAIAAASGAKGLVMCPLNDNKFVEGTPEKAAGGLKGFVEPLGFPVSSLRFKREALAAIDDIGGADIARTSSSLARARRR